MARNAQSGGPTRPRTAVREERDMSKRTDFEKGLEERLDLFNARVKTLKDHVAEETKTEDLKKLVALTSGSAAAAMTLEKLKATTGEEWDVVRAGLDHSWTEIDGALVAAEAERREREDRASGR
jgi:hypothetical protein